MVSNDINQQSSQLKNRLRERQISKDRVNFRSQASFMSMIGTQEDGEQISSIMYSSNQLDTLNQSALAKSIDFTKVNKSLKHSSNTCDSEFFSKLDANETTKNTDES